MSFHFLNTLKTIGKFIRKRISIIIAITCLILLGGIVFVSFYFKQDTFPNLVLITLDTVRADYLGCYGHSSTVSPNLDRLAKNSVVFERAYSTAPFTGPSHASILTSQHPSTHGIVFNGHRSPTRLTTESSTIANHLHEAGYSTAAFVSVGCLDKKYGFDQGFAVYERIKKNYAHENGGWGKEVSELAKKWLNQNYQSPFFLWVHYFDPHLNYICPSSIYEELEIPLSLIFRTELNNIRMRKESPPPNIQNAYRAEVYEMDKYIGELLETLDSLNLRSSTVIAVVADHGEYLGEHGFYDHHSLYEEVIRVPMMIAVPDMGKTTRRKDIVSTIDLVPTLLPILGVDSLDSAQGRDLLKPSASEKNIPVFSEWRNFKILNKYYQPRPEDFLISVQHQQYKLIFSMISTGGNKVFDLVNDPGENENLVNEKPDLAKQLEQLISLHVRNDLPSELMSTEGIQISSESMEMLKALGYIQ